MDACTTAGVHGFHNCCGLRHSLLVAQLLLLVLLVLLLLLLSPRQGPPRVLHQVAPVLAADGSW